MTPKQQLIYSILKQLATNGEAKVCIHADLGYRLTPDSINPAITDFTALVENEVITGFERLTSRTFLITGIVPEQ